MQIAALFVILIAMTLIVRARSRMGYTGEVEEVKYFGDGSVAIELDSSYAKRMIIFIPPDHVQRFSTLPTAGDHVTVCGTYQVTNGNPEIIPADPTDLQIKSRGAKVFPIERKSRRRLKRSLVDAPA